MNSNPTPHILYKAPLMANKLHMTNVSLDMRIDVRSMGDILGSTNLANAAEAPMLWSHRGVNRREKERAAPVFTVKADLTGLYIA